MKKILLCILIILIAATGCSQEKSNINSIETPKETDTLSNNEETLSEETSLDIFKDIVNSSTDLLPKEFLDVNESNLINEMTDLIVGKSLQPINYYKDTVQYSMQDEEGNAYSLIVIRFDMSDEELYQEGQDLFNEVFDEYKKTNIDFYNNAKENDPDLAEILKPYQENSAYYRTKELFVFMYGQNGKEIISKKYPETEVFFK